MNLMIGTAVLIVTAFFLFAVFRDTGVSMILNPDAILIIFGGTIVALFVGFPYKRLRDTLIDVIDTFKHGCDRDAVVKEKAIVSETLMNITIEGVIAINNMDHPLKIEEKLTGFNEVNNIIQTKDAKESATADMQIGLQKL